VTYGPNYEDQKPLPINTEEATQVSSSHLTANIRVRIQRPGRELKQYHISLQIHQPAWRTNTYSR